MLQTARRAVIEQDIEQCCAKEKVTERIESSRQYIMGLIFVTVFSLIIALHHKI
jgi:hypothetical protein